jgi:hypothetical protein
MKEYKTKYNSFVGGWFIPLKICDDLIKYFNKNKKLSIKGKIYSDNALVIKKEEKDSEDIHIRPDNYEYPFSEYRKYLQLCLDEYLKKYSFAGKASHFNVNGLYNLQYYPPGGGFKAWHCESAAKSTCNRYLTFMTYLNNAKNAGTEFFYQKLTTPCEKGLTLIWPGSFTHIHRGQITKKYKKYIATGWFTFT